MIRTPSEGDFERWIRDGTITPDQARVLRADLSQPAPEGEAAPAAESGEPAAAGKGIDPLTVAYYLGALLILGAMSWFLGTQWTALGHAGAFLTAAGYAALFGFLGARLRMRDYPAAGGLLLNCALWMVPVMLLAVFEWGSFFTGPAADERRNVLMGSATAVCGLLLLRFVRFPFLVATVCVAFWSAVMSGADAADLLGYHKMGWASAIAGAFLLAASFLADRRFVTDLAFWGYLCGVAAFWGGLSSLEPRGEAGKACYAAVNGLLLLAGIYLDRRAFLVFGTCGLAYYFWHLADKVFGKSPLFPLAMAFLGLAILMGAVWLRRRAAAISAALDRYRPARLRSIAPVRSAT